MPRFRIRLQTLVDREIDAFDVNSAERQAKFIASEIRYKDSDGDPQHASIYSIEEIKEAPPHGKNTPPSGSPFAPRPQRRFAA